MVFSGLLGGSASNSSNNVNVSRPDHARSKSDANPTAAAPANLNSREYILDEDDIGPATAQAPDLRELNNSLEALATVFPDIQIEVFREMLSSFDGESRLAVVADALLKNRTTWVKGRWRVAEKGKEMEGDAMDGKCSDKKTKKPDKKNARRSGGAPPSALIPERRIQDGDDANPVPRNEVFKTPEYKKAVKTLAWQEFKGLPRSTINAVLAEQNFCYLDARRTLVGLSSRSWRFTLSSLFLRRKPVTCAEAENDPLVSWKSTGHGSIVPALRSTGNAELDAELFAELVAPLKRHARAAQEDKDRVLASVLNTEEAEAAGDTHECGCCFTTATFEEFTTCNADGHLVCFRCVQHSVSEAVFGQGWHRSIDTATGTLRCPALDADGCSGTIPANHLHRAMLEEKRGAEILHALEQRLAEHSLLAADMPLVRCPFCTYAEVDEIYVPAAESNIRLRADRLMNIIILLLIALFIAPVLVPILLLSSLAAIILSSRLSFGDRLTTEFCAALTRLRRRRRGLKFTCRSPRCARTSCLSCGKPWADVHVCHESSLVALRTQVEQAMSLAIKRVCPRCNTSFVKNSGCNKLTCPCGYKMCYVCRKDIGGTASGSGEDGADADVGYRHFCQHFRPEGDPRDCKECNKCNLWESEDTEAVLRVAKEEAERRWKESEGRELSGASTLR